MPQANKKNNLRIAEIMQQKGITLNELAAKITRTDKDNNTRSLAAPTLSSRINGNPSLSNLYEIADALGVKITELFPEEDQWQKRVLPNKIKMRIVCPSCGANISTTVEAE
nr:MAG TPA: Helix-turn-helix XRE-family like protein [Caudoviricetes sp.]